MAQEILELQVNSNVKGVTKDVDALTQSVEKAYDAEAELSKNIELQNQFIADQEVELARLKEIQDSIPKGGWYAGQAKLTEDINKVTSSLRTEKAALKKLRAEQKLTTKAAKDLAAAQKKNTIAAIRGIQHFQVMGVSIRKLKFMIRGVVPMFKLLFSTIRNGIRSTGIGAIILALIAIGTSMKKSVAGGKAFKDMMKVIGAVVKAVTDSLTFLGDAMLSVFGYDSSTDTAVTAAEALEKAYEKLGQEMDKIALKNAKGQKSYEDNKRIIDDTTKSEEERLAASKENAEFDEGILQEKIAAQEKLLAAAKTARAQAISDFKWEQKRAIQRDDWNAVANDSESAFSKAKEGQVKGLKKVQDAELELQKLRNKAHTNALDNAEELTDIRSHNIDKIADDEEEAQKKREKAIERWKKKQEKIAQDELSIAKQLEKVKNELFYRTLETEQEVEEAKAKHKKEAAEQEILDSKASKETKDAALLVLEEKYQSDLNEIRWKYFIESNDEINEQQEKDRKQKAKDDKKDLDDKNAIIKAEQDFKKDTMKNTFGAAAAMAGENVALSKGVAIAQTIYSTQQGIMAAMGATSVADKLLPYPMRLANAIATGVMGAAAIAKISSTDPSSGGGGGGGGGGVAPATPAPEMMSGAFTLGGGQAVEPMQAYVVSDDITNNQNKLAIIRRRATI
jgi:hypothetical protein